MTGSNVAVVILNWNGLHFLQKFIPGIVRNSAEAQIVLADNASTDDSILWLEQNFPDRKEKVLNRLKSMRNGKLNNTEFGARMKGEGEFYNHIKSAFEIHAKRLGLNRKSMQLSTDHFVKMHGEQLGLFS